MLRGREEPDHDIMGAFALNDPYFLNLKISFDNSFCCPQIAGIPADKHAFGMDIRPFYYNLILLIDAYFLGLQWIYEAFDKINKHRLEFHYPNLFFKHSLETLDIRPVFANCPCYLIFLHNKRQHTIADNAILQLGTCCLLEYRDKAHGFYVIFNPVQFKPSGAQ